MREAKVSCARLFSFEKILIPNYVEFLIFERKLEKLRLIGLGLEVEGNLTLPFLACREPNRKSPT